MILDFKVMALALLGGFILDLLIGDPRWLPHPVQFMGKYIEYGEKFFRKVLPDNRWGLVIGGMLLSVTLVILSILIPLGIIWIFVQTEPFIYEKTGFHINMSLIVSSIMCWQVLAAKDLKKETMAVYNSLNEGDIKQARKNLSMVVGRDTEFLGEQAVSRAAVETISENASDGVIAPLFFFVIGGAPLAFAYKAINTLDSMLGYKNEKYIFFGRYPAILDDIANFIPARLTGLIMVVAAFILRFDGRGAWRIMRRDGRQHTSPNSGIPEAACAGALQVRLGGLSLYNFHPVDKPYIGDDTVKINREHIKKADSLMMMTAWIPVIVIIALAVFI